MGEESVYAEGSIDFKTGPNGTEWGASAKGGYEDGHGRVEAEVRQNDKGETGVSARGGYEQN